MLIIQVMQSRMMEKSLITKIEGELVAAADKDQILRFTMMWLLHGKENSAEILEEIYSRKLHIDPLKIISLDLYMSDALHAKLLLEIIFILRSWPHTGIVSTEAAFAAWLIAQHADPTPGLQEFFLQSMRQSPVPIESEYLELLENRIAARKSSN